jgi:hypothetical protein
MRGAQAHALIALAFFVVSMLMVELYRVGKDNVVGLHKVVTGGLLHLTPTEKQTFLSSLFTLGAWALAGVACFIGKVLVCIKPLLSDCGSSVSEASAP